MANFVQKGCYAALLAFILAPQLVVVPVSVQVVSAAVVVMFITFNAKPGGQAEIGNRRGYRDHQGQGHLPVPAAGSGEASIHAIPRDRRRLHNRGSREPTAGQSALQRQYQRVHAHRQAAVLRRVQAGAIHGLDAFVRTGLSLRSRLVVDQALSAGQCLLDPADRQVHDVAGCRQPRDECRAGLQRVAELQRASALSLAPQRHLVALDPVRRAPRQRGQQCGRVPHSILPLEPAALSLWSGGCDGSHVRLGRRAADAAVRGACVSGLGAALPGRPRVRLHLRGHQRQGRQQRAIRGAEQRGQRRAGKPPRQTPERSAATDILPVQLTQVLIHTRRGSFFSRLFRQRPDAHAAQSQNRRVVSKPPPSCLFLPQASDAPALRIAERRAKRAERKAVAGDAAAEKSDALFIEGSVRPYKRHYVVVEPQGADPRAWPAKLERSPEHILSSYMGALAKEYGGDIAKVKKSPLLVTAAIPYTGVCSGALREAEESAEHVEEGAHDVMVFPDGVRVHNIVPSKSKTGCWLLWLWGLLWLMERFVGAIAVSTLVANSLKEDLDLPALLEQEDERCGCKGPELLEWLKGSAAEANRPLNLWTSSHYGGHRYAAACIVYPSGDWFGLLNEEEKAKGMIDAMNDEDPLRMYELWRGRMGLTEPEMHQAVKDRVEIPEEVAENA
ncbi:hypothetical protein ON010_g10580 [Phytophthora cinnamomi]|nr:hypothetical protein ON010_g10580 [Phytophthora cinnamomi]